MSPQAIAHEIAICPPVLPRRVPSRALPALTSLTLLAADVIAIFLARTLATYGWRLVHPAVGPPNLLSFWHSLGLFTMLYGVLKLYSAGGLGPWRNCAGLCSAPCSFVFS